jgi:hypothetical protein
MERIVKRFLLHSQRESDNAFEREFEELKQDLQTIRYEMLNDLRKSKEQNMQNVFLLHSGLSIIGEELFSYSKNSDIALKFGDYKLVGNQIKNIFEDDLNNEARLFHGARIISDNPNKQVYTVSNTVNGSASGLRSPRNAIAYDQAESKDVTSKENSANLTSKRKKSTSFIESVNQLITNNDNNGFISIIDKVIESKAPDINSNTTSNMSVEDTEDAAQNKDVNFYGLKTIKEENY